MRIVLDQESHPTAHNGRQTAQEKISFTPSQSCDEE